MELVIDRGVKSYDVKDIDGTLLTEWGGQDITIRFAASGGLEQLVRLLMPYIGKEKARRGARLVVGGN